MVMLKIVWSTWEELLARDNIPFCTRTFLHSTTPNGDECGSAVDHANKLAQIVQVKSMIGQDQGKGKVSLLYN
jgi:hypothetical protein